MLLFCCSVPAVKLWTKAAHTAIVAMNGLHNLDVLDADRAMSPPHECKPFNGYSSGMEDCDEAQVASRWNGLWHEEDFLTQEGAFTNRYDQVLGMLGASTLVYLHLYPGVLWRFCRTPT